MGQLSFVTHHPECFDTDLIDACYMAGLDAMPHPSSITFADGLLTVRRQIDESGTLQIPWKLPQLGSMILGTATLVERTQPYSLELEIARGALNRLRNYQAAGQLAGYETSQDLTTMVEQATTLLAESIACQATPAMAAAKAQETSQLAVKASEKLAVQYAHESLRRLTDQNISVSKLYGVDSPEASLIPEVEQHVAANCNAAQIDFSWGDVEPETGSYNWAPIDKRLKFCSKNNLRVMAGPIIDLQASLPDWLFVWADEFDRIREAVRHFVAAVVRRYHNQVHVWNAIGGLLQPGKLDLRQEQRLQLAVDAIEIIRQADPRTPVIVSFSQPWAEAPKLDQQSGVTQLHLADSLVRSKVGLAGVALDLSWGYWPHGTMRRDLLELSHHLDRWGVLGVPLLLGLATPHSVSGDNLADVSIEPHETDDELAAAGLRNLMLLLMSKPSVQGIFWSDPCSAIPHQYRGAGLLDAKTVRTEAMEIWQEFFEKYQNS